MKCLNDRYTLRNGVQIPCVGFGTWQTPDGDIAADSVRQAIECGYRHIDTAAVYGNEESVGRGIRESGIDRRDLFVTTKVWNTDHGYEATLRAFDDSMKRLGLDYCDLYLIHWPAPAPIRDRWAEMNAQTWRAMEKLYLEGRIRAIGLSNFWPHHIDALLNTAVIMPMVNQIRLNPADQHAEVAAYSRKLGMLLEAYSPLGTGGVLTQPEIVEIAGKHGRTAAQVCIRWSLQKGYLPMPKSVTPERIRQNTEVFDFELDDDDMSRLDAMENRLGPSKHPDTTNF
ncbi:MAG: aldo/keto reductase [Clostridia bacterium]|nr:aldo/keto reductase [Clostridia bacterium]